ncbi:hypothetical protein BT69DRAFT_198455 [Atractiella rhizophila]|nr:hypothetical protein BT69DRAFT_198455 [Atractiella rhizophila]
MLLTSSDDPILLYRQNLILHASSYSRKSLPHFRLNDGDVVQLLRTIRSGDKYWGQIYEVAIPNMELNGTRLVLKIYDERLFPSPAWELDEEVSDRVRRWPDAAESLGREQTAYSALRLLQGSSIPKSYGFYELELSDGSRAPAHLLELVEGPHLHKADLGSLPLEDQRDFVLHQRDGPCWRHVTSWSKPHGYRPATRSNNLPS